jgi:hypothetical protein
MLHHLVTPSVPSWRCLNIDLFVGLYGNEYGLGRITPGRKPPGFTLRVDARGICIYRSRWTGARTARVSRCSG